MQRDDGEVVVVHLADLFAARQPRSSPLSPATGLDLPHLSRIAEPAPEPEPEPELEPVVPAVRITPAFTLRPLSDAICPECGQPRLSSTAHEHALGPSLDD